MLVQTEKAVYEVTIDHPERRNGAGEALKSIMAQNKNNGRTMWIDTYENPVTQGEMVDFLEEHDL